MPDPKKPATPPDPPKQPDPPAPPPADPPQQAAYVPADEFREFQRAVEGGFQQLMNRLNQGAPSQPSAPAVIDDVSDDEIEQAIAEGKGGSKLIRRAIAAGVDKVRREELGPLREVGLGSIAKLTRYIASKEMKFYDRYKREIDAAIDSLPPDQRLNPDVLIAIHNTIAGRPENIERMMREEREAALRQASAGDDPAVPGGRRGDAADRGPAVPTPKELLGEDAAMALEAAGRSPDRFAQGMGYRDWPHYAEERKKFLEAPAGGNA